MHSIPTQILQAVEESVRIKRAFFDTHLKTIADVASLATTTLRQGNKLLFAGNGGSAADSQHLAAELVGRFQRERSAWPALALTTDSSVLTAIANDYGYAQVFRRQIAALGNADDLFYVMSTSGNSENLLRGVEEARERKLITVALLGNGGGALAHKVDHALIVPANRPDRIQEIHLAVGHLICDLIETSLSAEASPPC